jgi:DHA1 family multidrug resistance protein-like MFS transporter
MNVHINRESAEKARHPDDIPAVRVLFILSVSVGVAIIGLGIIWPLIPVYALDLGATGFQVGMIIASFNIARVFANPVSGRLSDRWGRKPFITTGLCFYALVSILYILATDVNDLIMVRFLHGLTSVLVVPVAMALAADIAPDTHLARYMGTLNMAVMLGLGLGPILGGIIRDTLGMNAAFYAMGLLALLTASGVMLFIPGKRIGSGIEKPKPAAPIKDLLKHRVVLGLFFLRLFVASGQGSVYTFLPLLGLDFGITSSAVGIILGVNIFLIAVLQRLCAGIADRSDPRILIILGTVISGVAVFAMPYSKGFVMILVLNIVMGAANGISMPAGFVLTGQVGRKMGMGSIMGLTDAGWSLGMIASPIFSGLVMDSLGLPNIFHIGGVLIVIGSIVIFVFLRNLPGHGAAEVT